MTILVTGAQGYVGRYVVAALVERGVEVVGTGRSARQDTHFTHEFELGGRSLTAPLPAPLAEAARSPTYRYIPCDLAAAAATSELVGSLAPNRIIHLAGALRDEGRSALTASNIAGTANLARAAAALPEPPFFVYGSSGSVFGRQTELPVREEAMPVPLGSYAESKRGAEEALVEIATGTRMPVLIARIFNLLGPGLQPRHLAGYLAHAIAEQEASAAPASIKVGDLSTTRDLVDVRDCAEFLIECEPNRAIAYANLASGIETPMDRLVLNFLGRAARMIALTAEPARSREGTDRIVAEIPSMRALGLPRIGLDRSVAEMLAYARDTRKNES